MNKIKKLSLVLIIALLSGLNGCATPPPKPKLSPLQIEAMQTRQFAASKHVVFNAVISVLQDLGYIIKSADLKTGFIVAQSPTKTSGEPGFAIFVGDMIDGPRHHHDTINTIGYTLANAFVNQVKKGQTHVRLNFVKVTKTSSSRGQQGERDKQVLNSKTYQNAFNQIRQQIFVTTGVH